MPTPPTEVLGGDTPPGSGKGTTFRTLARDPALATLMIITVGFGVSFGSGWGTTQVQVVLHWGILYGLHLTLAVLAAQITRTPGLPRNVSRVWKAVTITGWCYTAGDGVQLGLLVSGRFDREAIHGHPLQVALLLIGTVISVGALLTTSRGWYQRQRRARYWLDVAIVMTATTAFGDYSLASESVGPATFTLNLLTGPGLFLVGVLAIVRATLTTIPPMTRAAGVTVCAAATLEAALQTVFRPLIDQGRLSWFIGLTLLASTLLTAGARIQQLQVRGRRQPPRHAEAQHGQRCSRFGTLPYLAIALTNLLLIKVLAARNLDVHVWIVVVGAVVSTSLVVTRQLLASTDNRRLVQALGTTVSQLRRSMHERDKLTAQLHHKAYHDPLTGLPNRALFTDQLHTLCDRQDIGRVAVMLVDLDDFKPVNDTYGHNVGDQVLTEAAARMQDCAGPENLVARIGGDEFGILVQDPETDIDRLARRVLATVSRPYVLATGAASITASVGIAATNHSPDAQQLLTDADRAMYAAKHSIKGTYRTTHASPVRVTRLPGSTPPDDDHSHAAAMRPHAEFTGPRLPEANLGWLATAHRLPWEISQRYRAESPPRARPSLCPVRDNEQPQRLH